MLTLVQVKIQQLQGLVRNVLANQGPQQSTALTRLPPPTSNTTSTPSQPHTTSTPPQPHTTSTPSQPHKSPLPLHLRPQPSLLESERHKSETLFEKQLNNKTSDNSASDASHTTEDESHMTFGENHVTINDDSLVSTATTEQILHLLDELDSSKTGSSVHVPCRLCAGPVINL